MLIHVYAGKDGHVRTQGTREGKRVKEQEGEGLGEYERKRAMDRHTRTHSRTEGWREKERRKRREKERRKRRGEKLIEFEGNWDGQQTYVRTHAGAKRRIRTRAHNQRERKGRKMKNYQIRGKLIVCACIPIYVYVRMCVF